MASLLPTASAEEDLSGVYQSSGLHRATLVMGAYESQRYAVYLRIVLPHSGGEIAGIAERSGDVLTLRRRIVGEDRPQFAYCTVKIRVRRGVASVISEQYCSNWHGVGASFEEAASNLRISGVR